ncbi:hypothetical protein EV361DRAFT_952673 [Lentinula raphanica]|nr:hypothetical protein F5880DRAFT_1615249 [Lentinula raphanica]KAJ3968059.1 hypothetical protein EV361DRAFT_952673 [Lentinula raphanica]
MPPAPAAPPHIPTVVEVYTPFVIGAFLNIFLYGIAVSQDFKEVHTHNNDLAAYLLITYRDDFWLKLLVFYLFVFDTFNSICDIGLVFESLLLKFGDPGIVATSPWTLRLDGISTTLVSTPVQVYMAWRIRKITKMNIPAAIICVFALASLIGSIWLTIAVSNTPQFAKFNSFRAAPSLWLISSAIADIMIAVCLVYGLVGWILSSDQEYPVVSTPVHSQKTVREGRTEEKHLASSEDGVPQGNSQAQL